MMESPRLLEGNVSNKRDLVIAFNAFSELLAKQFQDEINDLRARLEDAMKFVPFPETMSGYLDPSAPDEVSNLIVVAARLHGRQLPSLERPSDA